MRKGMFIAFCMCLLLVACDDKKQLTLPTRSKDQTKLKKEAVPTETETVDGNEKGEDETLKELYITIHEQSSRIILYENQTTKELKEILPMSFSMEDLHQNEKFVYLNQNFTTNAQAISQIQKGDVMLFGSNCLVIFYESFPTTFQYTPIGRIEDLNVLDEIAGNTVIQVRLEMRE
ncbi:MAG: cyclophilin-like fold protein [Longicatena sp.]